MNFIDVNGLQVYVCRDNSQIAGGTGGSMVKHYWLKTPTQESGMGTARQGEESGNQYEFLLTPTETTDHGNRSSGRTAQCREAKGADEELVNRLIDPGQSTGPFFPPFNHCTPFARDVIRQAGGEWPFGPDTSDWPEIPPTFGF